MWISKVYVFVKVYIHTVLLKLTNCITINPLRSEHSSNRINFDYASSRWVLINLILSIETAILDPMNFAYVFRWTYKIAEESKGLLKENVALPWLNNFAVTEKKRCDSSINSFFFIDVDLLVLFHKIITIWEIVPCTVSSI